MGVAVGAYKPLRFSRSGDVYVDTYRNLNRDCISVRARTGEDAGRVIDYVDEITLHDVEFVVQPAGRQRVLEEERKNVHAFVRGYTVDDPPQLSDDAVEVTYNPYKYESFVLRETEQPIREASFARVTVGGVLVPQEAVAPLNCSGED